MPGIEIGDTISLSDAADVFALSPLFFHPTSCVGDDAFLKYEYYHGEGLTQEQSKNGKRKDP
jgi:hypothetical protein